MKKSKKRRSHSHSKKTKRQNQRPVSSSSKEESFIKKEESFIKSGTDSAIEEKIFEPVPDKRPDEKVFEPVPDKRPDEKVFKPIPGLAPDVKSFPPLTDKAPDPDTLSLSEERNSHLPNLAGKLLVTCAGAALCLSIILYFNARMAGTFPSELLSASQSRSGSTGEETIVPADDAVFSLSNVCDACIQTQRNQR